MIKHFTFAVMLMLGFSACQDSMSDKMIDEEIYELMFIEFVIIDQLDSHLLDNADRDGLREDVYRHYGVTEEEFRFTHQLFESRIDEHLERLQRINSKLREERDAISEAEQLYRERSISEADSAR